MGPTASGKSALALFLAEHLPLELISVDSALVYRGMDIGTAKPSLAERAQVPHHLIDICDPLTSYSAAEFCSDTLKLIPEIVARGAIPLLVGGTMLYYRALFNGLSRLPAADVTVRRRLEREAAAVGWLAMHTRLAAIDPNAAQRINPNDPQRIQRALEVFEITGRPLTELYQQASEQPFPYPNLAIVVAPTDRSLLHRRIELRFKQMLAHGLVDEVRSLKQRGDLNDALPALRAVGYRQVWAYLDGHSTYEEMVQSGIAATRQLAKRQFTWLRKEVDARWFNGDEPNIHAHVLKFIRANPM